MTCPVRYAALMLAVAWQFECAESSKTNTGNDPKKSTGSLIGEWDLTSVTKEGGPEIKGPSPVKAIIDGNKWTMKMGEQENTVFLTINSTEMPATMDVKRDVDGEAAIPGKGIWKLDGEELTMCFAIGEGERPKDFKPAQNNIVMVFQRAKK